MKDVIAFIAVIAGGSWVVYHILFALATAMGMEAGL